MGIELFGDHRVTGQSQLGCPVLDAAIEPRWSDDDASGVRDGDRLYVLTGSQLAVYDLAEPDPGRGTARRPPRALTVDTDTHVLYLAGADGVISTLDTTTLDAQRATGSGRA